ncbi:uncharacterized protein AAKU55_004031 [Oxalobacteraceae bacterium GrIS 1.11]
MTRILFWLALVFLVLMAIRSKLRGAPGPGPGAAAAPRRTATLPDAESMLCCAQCGVYYPASETVQARGREYCSQAHASFP